MDDGNTKFRVGVGGLAALDYIAEIGKSSAEDGELSQSQAYDSAFRAIREYEMRLASQFIEGISALSRFKLWGIQSKDRLANMPTFAAMRVHAFDRSRDTWERRHLCWHGHYYALNLSTDLGREPAGMVRLGLTHYNLAAGLSELSVRWLSWVKGRFGHLRTEFMAEL